MQTKNIKRLLIFVVAFLFFNGELFSQITQPAGVVTYVVKKEAVTTASDVYALTNAEKARAISYVDGF